MGEWHIVIGGQGIHGNQLDQDADAIFERCVDELKAAGHKISRAQFTYSTMTTTAHDWDGVRT